MKMSIKTETSSLSGDQHDIAQAVNTMEKIHDVLIAEQRLMKSRDSEALESLAAQKNGLLAEVEMIGKKLQSILPSIDALDSLPKNSAIIRLVEIIKLCNTINKDNQIIASVELKHSRDAIKSLRSLMQMKDVNLYGKNGELSVTREKRYLGST